MKHPIKTTLFITSTFIFALASSCNFSGDLISEELKAEYMQLGEQTVATAGGQLMSNLISALDSGGMEAAVPYCQLNASAIMDSVADNESIKKVRRTSKKFRNKANKASERDKNIMKVYEYAIKRGDSTKPILQLDPKNNQVLYYSPIFVQATCLKCHGNRDNGYTRANFDVINKHYPKDKAFNYNLGDFRGMWVVHLEEREEPQP